VSRASLPLQHPQQFSIGGHLPEAAYFYDAESGDPVGAVARFAPGTLDADKKTFRQFRFEEGRWCSGLGGKQLPLYRLAEVLKALKGCETIHVVEGEKCVEALRSIGLSATTNAGGAGKWRPEHAESLRGATVVVIPDNDGPGRKHAHAVAQALQGVAASVKVIALPGVDQRSADDGWDVADWLEAGGAADLLSGSAPLWAPSISSQADWPTPMPFGVSSEPEPFPLDLALPGFLASLAHAVSISVKVDVAAPAALIPAVISAAAGNAFSVRVSNGYREPNLSRYAAWSKPSGERGSETFRRIAHPLDVWMDGERPRYLEEKKENDATTSFYRKRADHLETHAAKQDDAQTQRELRAEAIEARGLIPKPLRRPLLYIGDTTSEALVRSMDEQGGGFALCSADARHAADEILGRYRNEGKTNDSVYLRAHGGDTIDRSRVGTDGRGELLRILRPSLAIAICVQPDKFAELAGKRELFSSGFLGRLNIFQPPSLVGFRFETGGEQPLDPRLIEQWTACITRIIDARYRLIGKDGSMEWVPIELCLDPEAQDLRRAFANELEGRQGPDGDLCQALSFASKACGETARLSALFHLAELALDDQLDNAESIPIPAATWRLAEAHQRWQLAETLRVLNVALEDVPTKRARRLLSWVARDPSRRRVVAIRDVISTRIVEDANEATALLAWLADRHWVRALPTSGAAHAGRWEFNPIVCAEDES
jgi:putative DNA primase/helicase